MKTDRNLGLVTSSEVFFYWYDGIVFHSSLISLLKLTIWEVSLNHITVKKGMRKNLYLCWLQKYNIYI